ncbi:MAG: PaaI family thioesterase [Alicyclobacillus macrosporangiidus]|uniref:PaaI family thioesterase n=1 Tax=Alicyclobacillus macrosporangiidus TaxID=392015 RepID=UPI0026EB8610|nr:PaaI family thioesterase [Alicyclobacillus macrosporangiidus]MCL6599833.1 PaaI family thioesterase [Alicyclobacillus macrosporangiidus]
MGSHHCFVCGDKNPKGLHVHFEQGEGGAVHATYQCDPTHQGWPGIQHGGITSALLDEACAYVTYFQGLTCMTGQLTVQFHAPIHVGETLEIRARPVRVTRRLMDVEAEIVSRSGERKASAQAKMVVLTARQQAQAGLSDP